MMYRRHYILNGQDGRRVRPESGFKHGERSVEYDVGIESRPAHDTRMRCYEAKDGTVRRRYRQDATRSRWR